MSKRLAGRRVLAITSNYGVEQDELMVPATQLAELGADVDIAAADDTPIVTLINDKNHGITVTPQLDIAHVDASSYDALVIPGGIVNADALRRNHAAINTVNAFHQSCRVVAAICHGPWLLLEVGMVTDRMVTSYPSLRTDIRNAGGNWVDEPVVRDMAQGQLLITSRTPNDLNRFIDAIATAMTTG